MAWEPTPGLDDNGHGRIRQALERGIVNLAEQGVIRQSDTPAIELARRYADDLDDDAVSIDKVGPQLTSLLVQLRMTPAARLADKGGLPNTSGQGVLDELRDRRRRRA